MRRAATTAATAAALLGAAPAATDAQDATEPPGVPIEVLRDGKQALAVANVRIKGATYRFVVDTGASGTIIDTSVAKRLKLVRAGRPKSFKTVGCSGTATPVKIRGWSLGGVALPNLTIASAKTGLAGKGIRIAGLLGSDVLQTFGKVTLDYKQARIALGG